MKISRHEVFRINFRYSAPKQNIFRNSVHNMKDRFPVLVKILKRAGLRNPAPPPSGLICNFCCSYCVVNGMRKHPFSEEHFNQTKLIWDLLAGLDHKIMVRINFDGETLADEWALKCAIHVNNTPNVKICELFTNNSIDPAVYMDQFQPEKTVFNCSYHPEQFPMEKFFENIDKLRRAGYRVIANMVITPDLIKDMPVLFQAFRERDILLRPTLLIGMYKGRIYPHDYSLSALEEIKKFYFSEFEFEYARGESPKGKDCYAGVDMLAVYLDGSVRRCNHVTIGQVEDIISGEVKLRQEPYPCPHMDCMNYGNNMGLKEFREQFNMSEDHWDLYWPKK